MSDKIVFKASELALTKVEPEKPDTQALYNLGNAVNALFQVAPPAARSNRLQDHLNYLLACEKLLEDESWLNVEIVVIAGAPYAKSSPSISVPFTAIIDMAKRANEVQRFFDDMVSLANPKAIVANKPIVLPSLPKSK